ncbi:MULTISPECIES: cortex morphogenetic protein CmpA [Bacillus]|nr:cortex morphogenetic protein CmpA [Bacillus smithii]MED0661178.1 cortex morphogenetic protein CmpA [Bacillus smithii]MED1418674.1 cortex morphogenetic protein CmpA [Bacillus smithii]MED1456110.1 cortex morphogenetic protein CmpA [Bacillus smithii]MED1488365.1 cortex morphogenetic protein CmpA [Bacillus smithii]MED4883261.1 cortex morphogenetic protein CmpA [Bacillus smithii]
MPNWLKNQMRMAFLQKDRSQIKLLNQCWFFYTERELKQNVKPLKSV